MYAGRVRAMLTNQKCTFVKKNTFAIELEKKNFCLAFTLIIMDVTSIESHIHTAQDY